MGAHSTLALVDVYVSGRVKRREIVELTGRGQRDTLRGFAAVAPHDPSKITRKTIERWLGTIRHLSPGTRRNRYSVVRCFIKWLQRRNYLKRDPMRDLNPPKVPRAVHRAISDSQAHALLAACENPRDQVIVSLGLQLGLRRAEIAGLEVGSFSPGGDVVVVTGKGGHQRQLPVTTALRENLRRYLSWSGVSAGPLIRLPGCPERGVTPPWIGRRVTILAYKAGIKERPRDGVSTHAMRHHAATAVYHRTGDVLVVRDMLGHQSLAVTQVYVKGMDVSKMREAMEGRDYRAESA